MNIIIINGPNLNLLGERETQIYGSTSFSSYFQILTESFAHIRLSSFQSNIEGEIIDAVQKAGHSCQGIVINPGGYAHTSVAIRDAIAAVEAPAVEVHISNIFNREDFREKLIIAPKCLGTISGFGLYSYNLAIEALEAYWKNLG